MIEGKDLSGMTIDPLVDIVLGEQKKHTTVKQQNCNPFWDEVKLHYFFFSNDYSRTKAPFTRAKIY